MVLCTSEKMYILLLLGRVFYRCLFGLLSLQCCSNLLFNCWSPALLFYPLLKILIIMCLGTKLCTKLYSTCNLLSFLDVCTNISHQIWESFGHYFFIYSFFPFPSSISRIDITYTLAFLMVPHRSLRIC